MIVALATAIAGATMVLVAALTDAAYRRGAVDQYIRDRGAYATLDGVDYEPIRASELLDAEAN